MVRWTVSPLFGQGLGKWTRKKGRDFSGGPVVNSSLAIAGDMGVIPGKIPHATEHLSPGTATREAAAMRSPHTTIMSSLLLVRTRESPVQQEDPV